MPSRASTILPDREPRTVTTLLAGRLFRTNGADGLCQIRNVSSRGMMVESPSAFVCGERVVVELRSCERLDGTVAWVEHGRVGVMFDAPLPVERILARNDSFGARAPRFAARSPARAICQGQQIAVTVENISQSGANLRLNEPRRLSGQFTVDIPGLAPRSATLRWNTEDSAGIAFLEAIPFLQLAQWLITNRGLAG